MNITDLINGKKRKNNKKSGISNKGPIGKSADLVEKSFRTLSQTQINKLIEIYRWDFEAFEYDFKSFENIGTNL